MGLSPNFTNGQLTIERNRNNICKIEKHINDAEQMITDSASAKKKHAIADGRSTGSLYQQSL